MKCVLSKALLLILVLLSGCSRQQQPLRHIVILVDTSASIEPESLNQCINQIATLTSKIERGDTVSVVPITGDADVQSVGRVLRFHKPTDRSAYDADLVRFSKYVQQALQEFRVRTVGSPTSKTDIFGSIRMASDEFATMPGKERALVIFSDFIEDDGEVDFKIDLRLKHLESAAQYAASEANIIPGMHDSTKVFLVPMRSNELIGLSRQRRGAIRLFWLKYFTNRGLEPVLMTDSASLPSSMH